MPACGGPVPPASGRPSRTALSLEQCQEEATWAEHSSGVRGEQAVAFRVHRAKGCFGPSAQRSSHAGHCWTVPEAPLGQLCSRASCSAELRGTGTRDGQLGGDFD